jgi:hypothetical protein
MVLLGGTLLLVGGIASFLLLRFPTYLVVAWVILIIIFSNLVSQELRSYYRLKLTALRMATSRPSSTSTPRGVDIGRNPVLKDITGTTDYLKALCLVFANDHPAQTLSREQERKV